jgi:tetratricopeptide (TPR) repeat protein
MRFRDYEIGRARLLQAAIIFAAAIALRFIAVGALGDLPISRTPQLDSAAYLAWARALVDNASYWPAYPEHAPGYPMFLAVVLSVADSLTAVRIVQAILGASACVMTARIAARTLTPLAFLPAGLLHAAYAPLIYLDTAILAEGLFVFLLTWSLDLATAAGGSRRRWLLTGVVLGAATIVRPTAVVLIPAYLIALWRAERKHVAPLAAALAGGAAIVIAPIVIQNWRITGAPLIQAYAGMNFYLGNRPSGTGLASARPGGEWDALEGEASRAGVGRNDQDRYYAAKAFAEIAAQPAAYLRLLGTKAVWAFQDEELRDTHSYYFFAGAMPWLRWLPSFGVMLALAAGGVAGTVTRERRWLLAYLAAMLLTVILLVVGTRYRIVLAPPLFALAGAGVAAVIAQARSRDYRRAGGLAALVLVVWGLSEWRRDDAARNFAEEWAFTGLSLLQEGKFEDAETAYREAISHGESSFAWDGLGLVLQRRELRSSAREAFERAVRINPGNATAWLHLGLSYEFLGNGRAAIAAYQKSLEITPQRAEAREMLDAALRRWSGAI